MKGSLPGNDRHSIPTPLGAATTNMICSPKPEPGVLLGTHEDIKSLYQVTGVRYCLLFEGVPPFHDPVLLPFYEQCLYRP